ncbi:MAG: antibiotic biosynthesis monooxygenase [Myxococcales bacterium]|nr:antibiotic biosynthesis monooxygenase [Myxococcales bacterium]
MAVMVLLECNAKPGTGDQLVATFKAVLPDTRAREGFVEIKAFQNQDDKDNIVLVETWENKAAYEAYLGWRKENGSLDKLVEALTGPPSIRYFDITDA